MLKAVFKKHQVLRREGGEDDLLSPGPAGAHEARSLLDELSCRIYHPASQAWSPPTPVPFLEADCPTGEDDGRCPGTEWPGGAAEVQPTLTN